MNRIVKLLGFELVHYLIFSLVDIDQHPHRHGLQTTSRATRIRVSASDICLNSVFSREAWCTCCLRGIGPEVYPTTAWDVKPAINYTITGHSSCHEPCFYNFMFQTAWYSCTPGKPSVSINQAPSKREGTSISTKHVNVHQCLDCWWYCTNDQMWVWSCLRIHVHKWRIDIQCVYALVCIESFAYAQLLDGVIQSYPQMMAPEKLTVHGWNRHPQVDGWR